MVAGRKRGMRITVGSRFTAKLAGPAALAMLLSLGTAAWAQEASSESVSDLRSEVRELQKEIHELKGEVQTVKSEQALVPPPPADQKPQTIGETVGVAGEERRGYQDQPEHKSGYPGAWPGGRWLRLQFESSGHSPG